MNDFGAAAMVVSRRANRSDAIVYGRCSFKHDGGSARDNKAILKLDLQSTFDKVKHSAILSQVSKLNMGERSYNYIKDFLTDRTAELRAGDLQTQEKQLGCTSTPPGSVISPMLFNLVLTGVAEKLADIQDVTHTIQADDITLWVTVDATEDQLEGAGLRCSPSKSELLILLPSNKGRGKTR